MSVTQPVRNLRPAGRFIPAVFSLLFVAIAGLTGCKPSSGDESADEPKILTRVGSEVISQDQLDHEIQLNARRIGGEQSVENFSMEQPVPMVDPRAALEEARKLALKDPPPLDAGFGALAVQHSDHQPTRYKGGILSPIHLTDAESSTSLNNELVERIRDLQAGEFSQVFQHENHFYLVRLIARQAPRKKSIGQVANAIRQTLQQRQEEQLREQFFTELSEQFPPDLQ